MFAFAFACCWAAAAAAQPATRPAERAWGKSRAGVSLAAEPVGEWRLDGAMRMDFAVRNGGEVAVPVPAAEELYGYLMLRQRETTYYTEQVFHAEKAPGWPKELKPAGELALPPADVGRLKVFASKKGLLLQRGYPTEMADGRAVKRVPLGTVAEVLLPGPAIVQHVVFFPRERGDALLIKGQAMRVSVGFGRFDALGAAARKRILADLDGRLRADAFSAKVACADAVRVGPPAVETLAAIARDGQAEAFAGMWAATALADIGGERAAGALVECLSHARAGVRHVAAYHGLKLRSASFDEALNRKATAGYWPQLTAWALLGYVQFRGGAAPPELVAASVDSEHDRVRAAVAEVFTRTRPVPAQMPYLHKLARDKLEPVRFMAAMSLRQSGDRSKATVEALIGCLVAPGDRARRAAADALCRITGRNWTYPAHVTDEEKQAVVRQWKDWWAKARAAYRPPPTTKPG